MSIEKLEDVLAEMDGECGGLFKGRFGCNGLGRACAGYRSHNAESRKGLPKAIEQRNQRKVHDYD